MVTASGVTQLKIPRYLIIIFLLLLCSISLSTLLYYNQQKKTIKAEKKRGLLTLAAFKASEIREWREERTDDAQVILDNIYYPYRIQQWLSNVSTADRREEILAWLAAQCRRADYTGCQLLDTKAAVRLSTAKNSAPLAPHLLPLVNEVLQTKKPVFSDLSAAGTDGRISLYLLVPLLIPGVGEAVPVGVVLFRIDPYAILYPLIQSEPERSASEETLLLRREGDSALLLNELRHRKNTTMSLRLPLDGRQGGLPARSLPGKESVFEGMDYRGIAVLAAVTAVPDSPWFLAVKIDTAEVLGPARKQVGFIGILLLALVTVAGISIMLFWRQQQLEAERRQYALELERRNILRQYEYLKKYANDLILLFDGEGTILEANDRATAAYGYSREELLQMHVSRLRAPEARSAFATDMQKVAERGGLVFETLHQKKDGTVFPVEISARIMDLEGRKLYQSIVRDITERKKAEEELSRSKNDLRAIIDCVNSGFMLVDPETHRIVDINTYALDMIGATRDQVINQVCHQFVCPSQAGKCPITDLGQTVNLAERLLITAQGDRLPILKSVTKVELQNGPFLIESFIDITQLKKAEEALTTTRDFLENIFNSSVDGIIISDYRGYIIRANAAVEKMLGFAHDELIGKHTGELLPQDEKHVETGSSMMNLLFEKGFVNNMENEWLCKDGTAVPLDINITLLKDGEGDPIGAAAFVREITGRKKAEEEKARLELQLYQSQKMEAVGHLAGGIAHDFNNILTAIMGYGSLLQAKLKEGDPLRGNVDQILTSAERAAALVRSLLAYSRKQIINPQPVKINEIVINVENMLHRIIGEDIDLQTALTEHDTTAVADAGQIEQLLINLATNARDAMPAGGALTITSAMEKIDEQFIKAHGYGTQGIYVLLTVSDTGSGMDEKTRQQIFEPFFTTKEVGKGTGLGLSTVYGIVKQHNGFINCYSETGTGTTFKIYLPLVKSPSVPAVQPSAIARPPVLQGGSETILLAEDDDDLRKLIRQVLEDFGYTVLAAADGDEAVGLFMEHHDTINLLLLDVIMPKKNGREAYAEMQKIRPAMKALFTSGYTADIIHKQGLLEKGLEFILKPVAPAELLNKVRDVLDK